MLRHALSVLAILAQPAASFPAAAAEAPAANAPLDVPFDFSRGTITVDTTIAGRPLRFLVDTGVNPSAIDLATAEALKLPVARDDGGETTGAGNGPGVTAYPGTIAGLTLGGREMPGFDTLMLDMGGFSRSYGSRIDGVLGQSFLAGKIVLFDYPARRMVLLARADDAAPMTHACARRWSVALRTFQGFPVIPALHIGALRGPATFDTGSNGAVGFTAGVLERKDVLATLTSTGDVTHAGARGNARQRSYRINVPVSFGPFTLPAGVAASVYGDPDIKDPRIANVGNRLPEAMKLKVLIDYPGKRMRFFGACPPPPAAQASVTP